MAQAVCQPSLWGAPSFSSLSVMQILDTTGLAEHVRACTPSQSRWLGLNYALETAQEFFAARVVTTGVLLIVLMATAIAAV